QLGTAYQSDWDNGTGLTVRGGTPGESGVVMDGLSLANHLINVPLLPPNFGAIESVRIHKGGFDAGYGDIRSGLVEVITRSGMRDRYSLYVDGSYSQAGKKHFGPHAYDRNGRIWETFAGEDAFEGTSVPSIYYYDSDGVAVNDPGWHIDFDGWDEMALAYATNSTDTDDDRTPQTSLELWKLRHRPVNYGDHPDYTVEVGLGGPVPGKMIPALGRILGRTTFNTSYRRERTAFPYPLVREDFLRESATFKLTYAPNPSEQIIISGLYSQAASVDGNNAGNEYFRELGTRGRPDGTPWGLERAARYFQFDEMYNEGFNYQAEDYNGLADVRWRKQYSAKTTVEAGISYRTWKVFKVHGRWRDTSRVKKIGAYWYDETPRGFAESTASGEDQVGMFSLGDGARGKDESGWKALSFRTNATRRIGSHNRLSFGAEYTREMLEDRIKYTTGGTSWIGPPGLIPGPNWQWWDAEPSRSGWHLNDRFEYNGIQGQVGLRLDSFKPGFHRYDLQDRYNKLYDYNRFGDSFPVRWPEMRIGDGTVRRELSPTLNLVFPYSSTASVYLNYGRYHQVPNARQMYATQANHAPWGYPIQVANTELPWPRTVSYQVGYQRLFRQTYSLNLSGYYQDISREPGMVRSYSKTEAIRIMNYVPRGYADRRGVELKLSKERGQYLTGWVGFQYDRYTGGQVGREIIYERDTSGYGWYDAWVKSRLETNQVLVRSREKIFRDAPTFKLLLNLHTPHNWGPGPATIKPLGAVAVRFFHLWTAQNPVTIATADTILFKDIFLDRVSHQETRLQIEKRFGRDYGLTFYVLIENPFNRKEFFDPGRSTDRTAYQESLRPGDRWGEWNKDYIRTGLADWYHFQNRRRFTFGARLNVN
ncbi:hypothetical protein ACFLT7_03360, partial [candidate division KSB1 bacterium]